MSRATVASVLQNEMKPGVGVSIKELMANKAISDSAEGKQNIVYFTLKNLIKAGQVDYSEKRGRERLFKMVEGADFTKVEFKKRGRVKKDVADEKVAQEATPKA
jgi:hypothetical protein